MDLWLSIIDIAPHRGFLSFVVPFSQHLVCENPSSLLLATQCRAYFFPIVDQDSTQCHIHPHIGSHTRWRERAGTPAVEGPPRRCLRRSGHDRQLSSVLCCRRGGGHSRLVIVDSPVYCAETWAGLRFPISRHVRPCAYRDGALLRLLDKSLQSSRQAARPRQMPVEDATAYATASPVARGSPVARERQVPPDDALPPN